jgi:hypothetical protein
MSIGRRLSVGVPVLALLGGQFAFEVPIHGQTRRRTEACGSDVLTKLKFLAPGTAWAIVEQPAPDYGGDRQNCMGSHLYLTDNNGQSWRDITPRPLPTRNMQGVFFLDRRHGWMLSTDALAEQENARFYLLSTKDGGKHWRTLVLTRPMFHLMDDYYGPSAPYFFDARHGWIVWEWHMMNSTQNALLATSDGGRTWKRLPDPPGAGPVQFLSVRDGWMIGGPENWEGVGRPGDERLWLTHDGGLQWSPVPLSVPTDSPGQEVYLIDFKFRNMNAGVVAAGAQDLEGVDQKYTNCFTEDGGKTWHFSQFEALSGSPSVGDKHIFWCIRDRSSKDPTLQRDIDPLSFALPEGFNNLHGPVCATFMDDFNGWAGVRDESGATKLIVTNDGGKSSKFISWPRASANPP